MKEKNSAKITRFAVRVCYVLLAASVVVLPLVYPKLHILDGVNSLCVIVPYYFVVPAGYAALIALDKMLGNIKKDILFDNANVRLLSAIVCACLYAAAVGIVGAVVVYLVVGYLWVFFLILAAGELFMCLICSIVKSVFSSAIEIKSENDLTI